MKCEQAKQLMHSSVEGLLNEQEIHKLNSHLDTCEACTVEYEEIKYMIQLMGEIDLKELPIGFEEELHNKLDEFASHTDSLEEIHENKEQIEISRAYERMPNPALLATAEFLDDKVYFRRNDEDLFS